MTYSALSSSMLSSEDIRSPDPKKGFVLPEQRCQQTSRTIPRHSFLIRIVVFTLLEFSFIALVSTALWKPIMFDLPFTITEAKGAVTGIAILWHTLAAYTVKDVLLNIFSAEWMEQHRLPPNLTLQELDSVSRLTAASKRATRPFRLGFISSLLLMLLNGLGPTSISTDFVSYDHPHDIGVAKLTIDSMMPLSTNEVGISARALAPFRANFITQLEVIEKNFTSYGFNVRQPNVLILWPSLDSLSENTTIRYQSDVIRYNFDCSWRKPYKLFPDYDSWMVEGLEWNIYYPATASSRQNHIKDPLILPMQILSSDATKKARKKGIISFFFTGRNSTRPTYIDLSGIPSLLVPCNATDNPKISSVFCQPLLASALVCDPRFEILPATIIGSKTSLQADISSGRPIVKNIPHQAAQAIFANSLLEATSSEVYVVNPGPVNVVSRQLFLSSLSFDNGTEPVPVKPLSLPEINRNMNNVLASSAKAYLSGYKPDDDKNNRVVPSFIQMNTTAVMEVQKMALVGSKPLLIVLSAIDGLLVVLLTAIVAITRADQLEAFELENIIKRFSLLNQDPTFQEETGIISSP